MSAAARRGGRVVAVVSPLFPQRGLNFTHSDQGAQVFHLCADFRHVQAAHVIEVLAQPSRLVESLGENGFEHRLTNVLSHPSRTERV